MCSPDNAVLQFLLHLIWCSYVVYRRQHLWKSLYHFPNVLFSLSLIKYSEYPLTSWTVTGALERIDFFKMGTAASIQDDVYREGVVSPVQFFNSIIALVIWPYFWSQETRHCCSKSENSAFFWGKNSTIWLSKFWDRTNWQKMIRSLPLTLSTKHFVGTDVQ